MEGVDSLSRGKVAVAWGAEGNLVKERKQVIDGGSREVRGRDRKTV